MKTSTTLIPNNKHFLSNKMMQIQTQLGNSGYKFKGWDQSLKERLIQRQAKAVKQGTNVSFFLCLCKDFYIGFKI